MFENEGILGKIAGTLFLGGLFYLSHERGRDSAFKQVEDMMTQNRINDLEQNAFGSKKDSLDSMMAHWKKNGWA